MTNKKSPNVSIVRGSVTTLRANPKVALMRPITSEAMRADRTLRT